MNPNKEYVVLLDETGTQIGVEEKMAAHEKGLLHKAFSVVLFNHLGEMLLQQRAFTKYHTPGLWTNACCSHPRPGEKLEDAVHRRLREELGMDCSVSEIFSFTYKFQDSATQLWEHENDSVFIGNYSGDIPFNPAEVNAIKWITFEALEADIQAEAEKYTFWFRTFLPKLKNHLIASDVG